MAHHAWPGNVRELKNAVERLLITTRDGTAGGFTPDIRVEAEDRLLSLPPGPGRLRDELERVEKAVIEAALKECHGEINATWQALGISRRALYERLKKYGIEKDKYK